MIYLCTVHWRWVPMQISLNVQSREGGLRSKETQLIIWTEEVPLCYTHARNGIYGAPNVSFFPSPDLFLTLPEYAHFQRSRIVSEAYPVKVAIAYIKPATVTDSLEDSLLKPVYFVPGDSCQDVNYPETKLEASYPIVFPKLTLNSW